MSDTHDQCPITKLLHQAFPTGNGARGTTGVRMCSFVQMESIRYINSCVASMVKELWGALFFIHGVFSEFLDPKAI